MPPIKRSCAILVFTSGQTRGVFGGIKREQGRRYAFDAAIGHMKINGHLARRYLKAAAGGRPPPSSSVRSATISAAFKQLTTIAFLSPPITPGRFCVARRHRAMTPENANFAPESSEGAATPCTMLVADGLREYHRTRYFARSSGSGDSQATRGMSLRVIPMSASSRSPRFERHQTVP